jgi:hypothetical protein
MSALHFPLAVARIERSEIRDQLIDAAMLPPGFAALDPGYQPLDLNGQSRSLPGLDAAGEMSVIG